MMNKRSKLALVLAFLLSATAVFTACGDALTNSESSSSSDSDYKTPGQLEQEANASYKNKIDEWSRYIAYEEDEELPNYSISELTGMDTNSVKTEIAVNNGVYVKTKTETVWKDIVFVEGADPVETVAVKNITHSVYNLETGEKIISDFKGKTVQFNGVIVDDSYFKDDQIEYTVNTSFKDGIIEVKKTTYVLQEDAEDETLISNYDAVITYSYYDKNGTELAKDLEEKGLVDSLDSRYVAIGEYTYLVEGGEVIAKVNRGEEHKLPTYASSVGYAYVKEGNYGYCVREDEMLYMPMGELTAFMLPGMEIQVTNKQYDIVAEYKTDCYAVKGYSILPSGNVYICELDLLDSNATEYDFVVQDMKFNVIHTVVDVTTGKASVMEKDYAVSTVYSNTTSTLQTGINMATMSNVYGEITMKEGYMLAEIQKFAEGSLSPNTVKVVLDESLDIVAELPHIIPNQFGYAGFIDDSKMLIATKAVGTRPDENVLIYYTANVETGDLNLFPHNYEDYTQINWFIPIEGGYYYGGKIYGEEWELLSELDGYTVQGVFGMKLLLKHNEYSEYYYGEIETYYNYEYDYELDQSVQVAHRDFDIESIYFGGYDVIPSSDHTYYYRTGSSDGYYSLYNVEGEHLRSWQLSESLYEYEDGSYNRLGYDVSRSVTVTPFGEDAYLVKVTENWYLTSGEVNSPSNNKHNKEYTRYYIMN